MAEASLTLLAALSAVTVIRWTVNSRGYAGYFGGVALACVVGGAVATVAAAMAGLA